MFQDFKDNGVWQALADARTYCQRRRYRLCLPEFPHYFVSSHGRRKNFVRMHVARLLSSFLKMDGCVSDAPTLDLLHSK